MTAPETESTARTVWALTDDRPGNNAQVLGVTDVMSSWGWPVEEKAIAYTGWARLPNVVRRATLAGVTDESRRHLTAPWPDLVVAAGRRAVPVARWVKRQARREQGKSVRLAQIMFPGRTGAKDFDLIAVPSHDAKTRIKNWSNVLSITGAPTRITPDLLAAEGQRWQGRFESLPRPYIAVVVGGATRRRPFPRKRAFDLGLRVAELAKEIRGSILLTTSRRTGRAAELALLQVVPEPRHVHVWQPEGENPYLGYLALADVIVVTGDSVTMCAEACATETPVYIYAPTQSVSAKHARLHRQLYDQGYAKPLDDAERGPVVDWTHPPLTPAQDVATAIRALFATAAAAR